MGNKRNAVNPIVELFKGLNTNVGNVENLKGNVLEPVSRPTNKTSNGWFFFRIPSERELSLSEAYNLSTKLNTNVEFLPISEGSVDIGSIADSLESKTIFLFTGIQVSRPTNVNLKIDIPNTSVIIYLNNVKLSETSGQNSTIPIRLQDGLVNVIQVLLRRKKVEGFRSPYLSGTLELDSTVPVLVGPPPPDVVNWLDDGALIYGSLGSTQNAKGSILSFYDSPYVSGWTIERTTYEELGPIISYTPSGTSGYNFVVSGTYVPNSFVLIDDEVIGSVASYSQAGNTTINVLSYIPSGAWEGKTMYQFKDVSNIATIDRTTVFDEGDVIRYVDYNVVESMPYSYRVASLSLIDKSIVGQFSGTQTFIASDNTPPGPIVLFPTEALSLRVDGNIVTVQHQYPDDPDLFGYKVYTNSGTLLYDIRRGSPTFRLDTQIPSGTTPVRYGEFDFTVTELSGFEVEKVVDAYVVTTYDFAGNELPFSSGTSISPRLFVDVVGNFTPFDHLMSPTSAQRKPEGIPQHMWDTAINIHVDSVNRTAG